MMKYIFFINHGIQQIIPKFDKLGNGCYTQSNTTHTCTQFSQYYISRALKALDKNINTETVKRITSFSLGNDSGGGIQNYSFPL